MHWQIGPLPLAGLAAAAVFVVLWVVFTLIVTWIADRFGPNHPVPDLRLRLGPTIAGVVLAAGLLFVVTWLSR
jgi:chromate transport protein ChrA